MSDDLDHRTRRTGRAAAAERACMVLRLTGIPFAIRRLLQRNRVTILFYHRPGPATFAAHVAALRKAYNLISLDSWRRSRTGRSDSSRRGRSCLPSTTGTTATTTCSPRSARGAPDGVPVQRPRGQRPAVLVRRRRGSEPLKRMPDEERLARLDAEARKDGAPGRASLSGREIERMRPFVDFQSHTVSHPILPRCGDEKAFRGSRSRARSSSAATACASTPSPIPTATTPSARSGSRSGRLPLRGHRGPRLQRPGVGSVSPAQDRDQRRRGRAERGAAQGLWCVGRCAGAQAGCFRGRAAPRPVPG